jgi:hypothetical protein
MTAAACPSDLALERHVLGRADAAVVAHARACPECAERLDAMRREGEHFRQFVYPSTVERIEAAAAPARRRFLLAVLSAPILAAAAAVLVLTLRPPPPDYLGTKGAGGIGLSIFAPGSDAARFLADGAEVPARSALRFRIRTGHACSLFLLSVDGGGIVSRLDGAGAGGLRLAPGQHDLAGGVELDGAGGPERFYAVCAPAGTAAAEVERAARSAAGGGPGRVRGAKELPGLPAGSLQASHLLEKRP